MLLKFRSDSSSWLSSAGEAQPPLPRRRCCQQDSCRDALAPATATGSRVGLASATAPVGPQMGTVTATTPVGPQMGTVTAAAPMCVPSQSMDPHLLVSSLRCLVLLRARTETTGHSS